MTDEQAVREWLAGNTRNGVLYRLAEQALALLDAKDEEIAIANVQRDAALSRAEQAEAALADLTEQVSEADRTSLSFGNQAATAVAKARNLEAALAEECKKHQAFRVEVSQLASWVKINLTDLILGDVSSISYPTRFSTRTVERLASNCRKYLPDLSRFILPAKPEPAVDPLVAILNEAAEKSGLDDEDFAREFRAAIERAGGTINFERNG